MIAPTPAQALRDAGIIVAVLGVLVGVALLFVQAGVVGAVAPPVSPDDDVPWLALNPPEVPSGAFEVANGMSKEAVVSQLGTPMRVRRDIFLPSGCAQSYVYATRVNGERTTTGLCFNAEGRVASFLGQTWSIDLNRMKDDPRDEFAALAIMSLIGGLPLAALAARRRLRPPELASLKLR